LLNRKIYTPGGLNDILHEECFLKKDLETGMRSLLRTYGYKELEPPTIEYYDVFSGDNDLIPQETMFKFFDQYGRILVLRPDLTISVARITATKLKDCESPIRHFYIGNAYKYNEIGGGKQKEFTQAGVEIIGQSNPESDAEVIATAINTIKSAGLKKFQIDIGQVEFFNGLMDETGLNQEEIDQIRELIDSKDYIGIEEIVAKHNIRKELGELILDLPKLFGSADVIAKAEKITNNERSLNALKNLRNILEIIDDYGFSEYVSVDLSLVPSSNNFKCYTGIIFKGFTYGVGFPILRGGRYDNLLSNFNDDRPATGFSLGINFLMMALDRQKIPSNTLKIDSLVCYNDAGRKTAFKLVKELRKQNLYIEVDLSRKGIEDQREYAKKSNIDGLIYVLNDEDIEVHNLENGEITKTSITKILNKV
jgi:ATP phosphoribosyltransferase regulatory subunit